MNNVAVLKLPLLFPNHEYRGSLARSGKLNLLNFSIYYYIITKIMVTNHTRADEIILKTIIKEAP